MTKVVMRYNSIRYDKKS